MLLGALGSGFFGGPRRAVRCFSGSTRLLYDLRVFGLGFQRVWARLLVGVRVCRIEVICGFSARHNQGTEGGTLIRDLRGYFGVIYGLLRYVGTLQGTLLWLQNTSLLEVPPYTPQ